MNNPIVHLKHKTRNELATGIIAEETAKSWFLKPVVWSTEKGAITKNPNGLTFRKVTWEVYDD